MRKILLFLSLLCCCSEVIAKCDYSGSAGQAIFNISPKIATDPTIPVGTVLYTKKVGTGHYKTFECSKIMGDQYIVESTASEVTGVTGIRGKPVYETGIDGIGFQFSDLLSSKNGSINPAVAQSTIVPILESNEDYKFMTVWLIKTKQVIDTSGTSTNPVFKFSAGNLSTNPRAADRLLLTATLKFKTISYKDTSCDISVSGPSQITLNKIEKNTLMSISRGGTTPSQKTIKMDVTCPQGSVGNKLYYWFNPVNGTSSAGDGIIDNMITGTEAANNVGVIFKIDNKPIIFYDAETYSFAKAQASQNFTFTADYYRMSDNSAEVSSGHVKAMLEVVIQEE
ncbi:fimbrial protein [Klebsiella variicola]|uniref:fimbrial protein n=1 Tax=Klebsiella variicola TaxID=244366 RepID=UPI0014332882|nr:fimbrial protein [Klebsiella variicola]MCH6142012.1 fimbrial protein [Klebsiella variicola]MCH6176338.1 fimbrial protein [Klebsiella variicola]